MLAFLGGTGPEGKGLALRLAIAGESVVIGSRDAGRAQEAADELLGLAPGKAISGAVNGDAAEQSDVVVSDDALQRDVADDCRRG